MKKLKIFFILYFIMLCCLFCGCATLAPDYVAHYEVIKSGPDFYGIARTTQRGNVLNSDLFNNNNSLQLNLEIVRDYSKVSYNLIARWYAGKRLNIQQGRSLVIKADGINMAFVMSGKPVIGSDGSNVVEEAAYPVTPAQIKTIAYAKEASLVLVGLDRGFLNSNPKNIGIKRKFQAINFAVMRKFIDEEILGRKAPVKGE